MRDLKKNQQRVKKVRQNRVKKKREPIPWRKFLPRVLRVTIALSSLALIITGGFFVTQFLMSSDLFKVEEITVHGNHRCRLVFINLQQHGCSLQPPKSIRASISLRDILAAQEAVQNTARPMASSVLNHILHILKGQSALTHALDSMVCELKVIMQARLLEESCQPLNTDLQ